MSTGTDHRRRRAPRALILVAVVAFTVPLALPGPAGATAQPSVAAITVGVVGTVTGDAAGLAGIDVRVYDATTGLAVAKTKTLAGGTYEVAVPAGSYKVRFSDATSAWRLQWFDGATAIETATTVVVGSGTTTVDAELVRPLTMLSGKAETYTFFLSGLPNIDVRVYDATTSVAVAKTRTGDDGSYRVADIPPGQYFVRFSDPNLVYGLTWYPTAGTILGAAPVVVTAGSPARADVRMYTTGWFRGTVHTGATPLAGIEVRLVDASTGASVAKAFTGADGSYLIEHLHLGAYGRASFRVRFLDPTGTYATQWFEGQPTAATAHVLTVGLDGDAGKQADADLLAVGGGLTGTVSDGATGLAGISVRIYTTSSVRVAETTSGAGGAWSVPSLPVGSYKVQFADDAGGYLPIWFASVPTFAAATPVTVTAGSPTAIGDQVLIATAPLDLVVDTAADAPDANPGDGVCDIGSGSCSLRAAVDETNASEAADTITIAAGVDPTLSIPGAAEDANATGDLDSNGELTIHGNDATLDAAGLDRGLQQLGRLRIDHLTITGGTTAADLIPGRGDDGGAILAFGDVDLTDTTLTGNHAVRYQSGRGGGIAVIGRFTMVRGTVTDNVAENLGGGIWAQSASVVITDSTIDGNQTSVVERDAPGNGSAAALDIGSIEAHGGAATISGTTISNNISTLCCGSQSGGGMTFHAGSVTVVNSSIVDNQNNLFDPNAATIGGGAGVSGHGGPVALVNVTVADNTGYPGVYQLLPFSGDGPFTVRGSIVIGALPVCNGAWISLGWNVFSDASCQSPFIDPTDRIVADALLGPLADNGGLTFTRLPLLGSPALDAVPIGTPGLCDGTIATDQRAIPRPQGTGCDIGAVERSP